VLEDGVIIRTIARDGMPRFSNDAFARNRPGFRSGASSGSWLDDYFIRDRRREAYRDYNDQLTNAWRRPRADAAAPEEEDDDEIPCPQCEGTGEVGNGIDCPRCYGEGTLPGDDAMSHSATRNERETGDRRSVAQQVRDHQRRMQTVYDTYSAEISQAWKVGK
jgi:hypothetical protein